MVAVAIVRILGSVGITGVDGRHLTGPAKQSCVLAALALAPHQPVTVTEMTTMVWDGEPPVSAPNVLYGHIMRLRRALDNRAEIRHRRDEGYVLDIDPPQIDLHHARELATEANHMAKSADLTEAAQKWRQACRLWSGPALLGVDGAWARKIREGLRREQVSIHSARFDAELALGRHAAVVRELEAAASEHPTAEELAAQLMLALYRCGRAAEALNSYERLRVTLRAQLGTAPAQRLQTLHRQMLRQDTQLDRPFHEVTATNSPSAQAQIPAQLPVDTTTFAGRKSSLHSLLSQAREPTGNATVTIVTGMAGVGKTTLVVHAGHQLAKWFPDGQLFLDLHGHTEGVQAIEPADALGRLLRTVGLPPQSIPDNVEDRAAAFRSAMADKRALLVLDNADDAGQVLPLLPAGPNNHVLITSRRNMSEIDDAQLINLETLPASESAQLFIQAARLDEPDVETRATVKSIVEACAHLPLALRIAAARLTSRKHWTVHELRDRLNSASQPLHQLGSGQRSVIAAFSVSFRELDEQLKRAFCLLGLAPGTDFDLYAAAALLARDLSTTEELLEILIDNHLLRPEPARRFSFHDLMRQYAARAAHSEMLEGERLAAIRRVVDMYCAAATEATHRGDTMVFQTPSAPPATSSAIPEMRDAAAAVEWWHQESNNVAEALILAITHELNPQAFVAVTTLWSYFHQFVGMDRMSAVSRRALTTAQHHTGSIMESWMLTFHGLALFSQGNLHQALEHLERSHEIRRDHDDVLGQAMLQHNCGRALGAMGRFAAAREQFAQAKEKFDAADSTLSAMSTLADLAMVNAKLGNLEAAWRDMRIAEEWLTHNANDPAVRSLRVYIGMLFLDSGDHLAAQREFEAGDGHEDLHTEHQLLRGLAIARVEGLSGRSTTAVRRSEEAVELARLRERRWEPAARNTLGEMLHRAGRIAEASIQFADAITTAESFGARYELARAHRGLAATCAAQHKHEDARDNLNKAALHFRVCGVSTTDTITEPPPNTDTV